MNKEKRPWERENWREAKGIIASEEQTNSALTERDYSVKCECPAQNKIAVIGGYWFWWCTTHHQPLTLCEKAKAIQQAKQEILEFIKFYVEKKGFIIEKYTSKPHYVANEWQPFVALLDTISREAKAEVAREIAPLVAELFETLYHADFSNGIEAFGIDEGRVRAKEYIKRLVTEWQSFESKYMEGK